MKYKKIWLVVILNLSIVCCKADELDSLNRLLDGLPDNRQKLEVLRRLSQLTAEISLKESINYSNRERELAQKTGDTHWLGRSHFSLGYLYNKQGFLGKSAQNYVYAINLFKSENDQVRLADSYYNLADLFLTAEDYLNAKLYFEESLKLCNTLNITEFLSWLHSSIGQAHFGLGNYEDALNSYELALSEAKAIGDSYMINIMYNKIGELFQYQENYDLARDNYYKSIEIEQLEAIDVAIAFNNIGETYMSESNEILAKEFFEKSLAIKDSLNAKESQLVTFVNIGKLYLHLKEYSKAKNYLNRAVDVARNDVIDRGLIEALGLLNEIHNLEAEGNVYASSHEMLKYLNLQTRQIDLINNLNDELAPLKNRYLLQVNYEVPMLTTQLSHAINSKNINSILAAIAAGMSLIAIMFMAYYMRKVFTARKMLSKF